MPNLIGTDPNQVPVNGMLGGLAYEDAANIAGQVGVIAGTAALPSLVSATDTDTGVWFPAVNTLALSTGGAERMRVDSSGNVGIGTSSPAQKLDVVGNAKLTGTITTTANADALVMGSGVGNSNRVNLYFKGTDTTGNLRSNYIGTNIVGTAGNLEFYNNISGLIGTWDTSGNLGIGTSAPTAKLQIGDGNTVGTAVRVFAAGTASISTALITALNGNGGAGRGVAISLQPPGSQSAVEAVKLIALQESVSTTANNASFVVQVADTAGTLTERARIDASGNLGIGTSSPSFKLDVVTAGTSGARVITAEYGQFVLSDGVRSIYLQNYAGIGALGTASNNPLMFAINSTEKMRLDASGNLGLGVTPSAWQGGGNIVLPDYGTFQFVGSNGQIASNAYFNGAWRYATTAAVALYVQASGQHQWKTAPSGTAGNTVSLTQAMTLNASGSLVVGSTTANRAGANAGISVEGASTSILESNINASRAGFLYADLASTIIGEFRNLPLLFRTNDTERMRLDAAGNLGIGTTTPGYKLQVNGSFAATTKSFVIDHPTKPGKQLRHGSLEGPENGVYVRGRLKGNKIELPEYWTKLVDPDSITVNLTAVGKHQKLFVDRIVDNIVYVGGTNVDCFYTVFGERIDVDKLQVEIG